MFDNKDKFIFMNLMTWLAIKYNVEYKFHILLKVITTTSINAKYFLKLFKIFR